MPHTVYLGGTGVNLDTSTITTRDDTMYIDGDHGSLVLPLAILKEMKNYGKPTLRLTRGVAHYSTGRSPLRRDLQYWNDASIQVQDGTLCVMRGTRVVYRLENASLARGECLCPGTFLGGGYLCEGWFPPQFYDMATPSEPEQSDEELDRDEAEDPSDNEEEEERYDDEEAPAAETEPETGSSTAAFYPHATRWMPPAPTRDAMQHDWITGSFSAVPGTTPTSEA